MKSVIRIVSLFLVTILLGLVATEIVWAQAIAQSPYTLVQINQGFSPAMDVNDNGVVVGW